ncbi:MAG: bifunctional riboflavin kinase/FAD synthetase [Mycoplasmatales bacterium]
MIYSLLKFYIIDKKYNNIALGSFDGVHLGHQKVIKQALETKQDVLVISFNMAKNSYIYALQDNLTLIQNIDSNLDILTINLDEISQKVTAQEFIKFLQKLQVQNIFIGEDYHFGYKRQGNIELLKQYFNIKLVEFATLKEIKISSTMIKEELLQGNIKQANKLLGTNYFVRGVVIKNKQLGRTINFPTINLKFKKNILKKGVYKTQIIVDSIMYNSITNVGVAPTINNEQNFMIETHILDDFNKEIYGKLVKVIFLDYIRAEQKFQNIQELQTQIKKDIKLVKGKNDN